MAPGRGCSHPRCHLRQDIVSTYRGGREAMVLALVGRELVAIVGRVLVLMAPRVSMPMSGKVLDIADTAGESKDISARG